MKKVSLLWSLLIIGSFANAKAYTCPDKIHLEKASIAAVDIPSGFQQYVSSAPAWLTGVNAYDGPPEEGGQLKPANVDENGSTIVWRFTKESNLNIWLTCDYADQLMQIAVKVDDSPSECVATVKKHGTTKILQAHFECQ
jgi:hypothetical protein